MLPVGNVFFGFFQRLPTHATVGQKMTCIGHLKQGEDNATLFQSPTFKDKFSPKPKVLLVSAHNLDESYDKLEYCNTSTLVIDRSNAHKNSAFRYMLGSYVTLTLAGTTQCIGQS